MSQRHFDVLYCEGPGDIVSAYRAWKRGDELASQTGVTFSGQLFEFCRSEGLSACALSYGPKRDKLIEDGYWVENLPRLDIRIPKIGYHLSLLIYTLQLLRLTFAIRPRVILMCTGVVGWGLFPLLRLSGAKLVPILHNTLWTEGYPPTGPLAKLRNLAYRLLWRKFAAVTFVVSAAAARQVSRVSGATAGPVIQFQPLFVADAFPSDIAPAAFAERPFRVLFVGRMEESKGVFDVMQMAESLQQTHKNGFAFSFCGDGAALPEVRRMIEARGLQDTVTTFGRLNREELVSHYLSSHVVIVPTRSSFAEGYAMVVAEAILALRPVITCPVVPAAEPLKEAVLLAAPDDPASYLEQLIALSSDPGLYARLVAGARGLRPFILDASSSWLMRLRAHKSEVL